MKSKYSFTYSIQDTAAMMKRCIALSFRNPDAFLTGIGTPVLMMLLFVYVLGGAMNVGGMNYMDYILPGIILQCIGQCGSTTAISVNNDSQKGIIDRFRSMPIADAAVLTGHAAAAMIRSLVTTSLILLMAVVMGFRPAASPLQWLTAAAILLLFIAVITWLSILFGLISGSPESANGLSALLMFLPYLSSGFAPTGTMPKALKVFAENQPMTPIIEALRSLLTGAPSNDTLFPALIWCIVLLIAAYAAAIAVYKRKTAC